jgi:exodeoxyribonuclease V beta subunit
MRKTKAFHILETPLEGTNLIEAGAGTGKTYAIAGLFLRLILEKNLSPNEILVVTFTEAATAELKDRIRGRLLKAIGVFSGDMAGDDFLNALLERNKNPRKALALLRDALRTFDLAAIFTIHGFCHRMLYEYAFESGLPFDTELMPSQENLMALAVDDFWRVQLYEASPLFVNYVMHDKFTPNNLLSLLGNRVTQPFLRIIPHYPVSDTSKPEKDFSAAFKAVKEAWKDARPEIENVLLTDKGLNRIKYRETNIPKWFQYMDRYLETAGHNPLLFDAFERFTESGLKTSVKQGFAPPAHPFFRLCEGLKERRETLVSLFEKRLNGLKGSLFQYVREQMSRRKQDINVQSFDDLLSNLQQALSKGRGKGLSKSIRKKFRAALIDEFQDTDALQYGIFNDIFGSKETMLFLIGDPKQAIYSFRSADIFAYMKAAANVASRHTLLENWRSDSRLLTAINTIFERVENPFVYGDIPFQSAVPSPNKKAQILQINGKAEAPFHIWYMRADQHGRPGRPIPKGRAYDLIPKAVAAEISRLLPSWFEPTPRRE